MEHGGSEGDDAAVVERAHLLHPSPAAPGSGRRRRYGGQVPLTATNESAFAADVLAAATPVLVDFSAVWCPPCLQIEPVLEQIATDEAAWLRVLSVDVDENPVVADLYAVTSMPTLVLFRAGQEVVRITGVKAREAILAELHPHLHRTGG